MSRSLARASRDASSASAAGVDRAGVHLRWLVVLEPPARGRHQLDGEHSVDVGGPELEHLHHPAEGGERLHVAAEPLEDRSAPLRSLVHDRQPVLVVGHRIHQEHARPRVLREVLHGLREELVRQRHSLVVHPVHPRQVRDVRHAVGRRCGDHGRDGAAEAPLQLRELHVEHARPELGHQRDSVRAPAPGPGVWSNISSTLTTQATYDAGKNRSKVSQGTRSVTSTSAWNWRT